MDVSEYTPPSALGGDDEDLPEFWNLITDYLEGWTWPGADTDRLRQAATAWRTAATNFGGLTSSCDVAVSMFEGQRSPEIPLAIDATKDLRTHVSDLATELKAIGDACDDYAEQVDQTREVIRGFLKDLAIEAGVTVVVGGVVTFFTAGLGAGGTAAVAGWRLSACARKIIGALTALKAVRAVTTIARTAPQLAKVRSVLAKFKRAKKMDNAADAAEQAVKRKPTEVLDGLKPGRNKGVKEVADDAELQKVWDELKEGGELIPGRGGDKYDGWYRLPDGTEVGLRTASKSGGRTIDIILPDGKRWKVHTP